MLRRRWEVMDLLKQIEEPSGNSSRTHARAVAREIMTSYQGDSDPETTVGVAGAAYILIDIEKKDRVIVTPDDIWHAAETFAADIKDYSKPEIVMETRSWLPTLNLIEVDTDYCQEWQHFDRIWTAPIYSQFDDLITQFETPAALSLPTIKNALTEAFNDSILIDSDTFAGGKRGLDDKELDAFMGHYESRLDDLWTPIASTNEQVWIDPKRVHEQLSAEDDRLEIDEVTTQVVDIFNNSSFVNDELLPGEINSENIGPLMDKLQNEFNWHRLGTSTGIHWYSDRDTFIKDYKEHSETAQEIVDDRPNASIDELVTAKIFFEHNQEPLLELEDTTPDQLDYVVDMLNTYIYTLQQESQIEQSTSGDNLTSSMNSKTPTAYHVAKKFEQRLEELRREDDKEGDPEKGLGGVRY